MASRPVISPERILKEVPHTISVKLPEGWFDRLQPKQSVWGSFYRWIKTNRGIDMEDISLHTYASRKLYRMLLQAEEARLAKTHRLSGKELETALFWSQLNYGPHKDFSDYPIGGSGAIILLEKNDATREAMTAIWKEMHNKEMARYRALASGSNFGQWLASFLERKDRVGDLARDAVDEPDYPNNARVFRDVLRFYENVGASSCVIESAEIAWLEYQDRYPERIVIEPICEECCDPIAKLEDGVFACPSETYDIAIYHHWCAFEELCKFSYSLSDIKQGLIGTTTLREAIEDVGRSESLNLQQLRLNGFRLVKEKSPGPEWVYFIRIGDDGPIKIGYTQGDPSRRIASLQTAHPERLALLAKCPGGRATERDLHERFRPHRLNGEWFSPHDELINFISTLKP